MNTYDIVIAGAGTAGATAAVHLTRAGFRVAVLEKGELNEAGARWVNAVPPHLFDQADIARPREPELRAKDYPFFLADPTGKHLVRMPRTPFWEVDMRLLVQRLQGLAADAGAVFFANHKVTSLSLDGQGRPAVLSATNPAGPLEFGAKLFVDATGTGVLRKMVPKLDAQCPPLGRGDLCGAAQQVHKINHPAGAQRFLDGLGIPAGSVISYTGVHGGFSALYLQISADLGEIDILTGSTLEPGKPTCRRMMDDFIGANPWIGELEFGGAGVIPLRGGYDVFAAPGLALVGDSACQVFPAHGSGIPNGMIAGRILAEAVKGKPDPGAAPVMACYQKRFHREVRAVLAAYDVFRKLSATLSAGEISTLFSAGLMSPGLALPALEQKMPRLSPSDVVTLVKGALRAPRLAARFTRAAAEMQVAYVRRRFGLGN